MGGWWLLLLAAPSPEQRLAPAGMWGPPNLGQVGQSAAAAEVKSAAGRMRREWEEDAGEPGGEDTLAAEGIRGSCKDSANSSNGRIVISRVQSEHCHHLHKEALRWHESSWGCPGGVPAQGGP